MARWSWTYNAKKHVRRKGNCEVVPCDQKAVAHSVGGVPVCLRHGHTIGGGFRLMSGYESLIDFQPAEEVPRGSR